MTADDAFASRASRSLRDPETLSARLRAVRTEPRVQPLNDWVEGLRRRLGGGESVPWFDPASGGVEARSLFLLEAPGPKSVGGEGARRRAGSGVISVDNDDPTAHNCWTLRREAGLPYRESVHWNIVPWYLGTDERIAAPGREEVRRAAPYLRLSGCRGAWRSLRACRVGGAALRRAVSLARGSAWFTRTVAAVPGRLPRAAASRPPSPRRCGSCLPRSSTAQAFRGSGPF